MLLIYTLQNQSLKKASYDPARGLPADTLWIDLFEPTPEEEKTVEDFLKIGIPTREEMHELELSNRFYEENNALYLTVTLVAKAESDPESHVVTFVLAGGRLVTVRYVNLQPFQVFCTRAERGGGNYSSEMILAYLLEAMINRLADILEVIGHDIEQVSRRILRQRAKKAEKPDFQLVLEHIGNSGDLLSKTRESMVSIQRLLGFLDATVGRVTDEARIYLSTASKDVGALSDHAMFLSAKVNFILDATLGMINIEQNNILKIFSVAAVVFLPPTLIASIYGMNFHHMPELAWMAGYPTALGLMLLSAILPYAYFKQRKWL